MTAAGTADARTGPLSDLRVLDLTLARAGPACVRVFADWGADVIRIEQPPAAGAAAAMGRREGSDHLNLHRNKRGLTLDLKSDRGREIFLTLVETADLVVENMRPGVVDRLGVGYEAARARNPRIVYGSISGYGHDGPLAERPCFDQVGQGFSGIMSVTGEPDGAPMRAGVAITDLFAGALLAQGLLAALHDRARTGEGRWVRTSLVEAGIATLDFQAARWLVDREAPPREGNHHPTLAPMGLFPTADGYINLAAFNARRFAALCRAIGAEALLEDPRFADEAMRAKNRPALIGALSEALASGTTAEWLARLEAADIPCGPVNDIPAVFAHPQVQALDLVQPAPHPERGSVDLLAQPYEISGYDRRLRRGAPGLGADTDAILEELDLDAEARAALREAGVV